jgi:hypothetical protein
MELQRPGFIALGITDWIIIIIIYIVVLLILGTLFLKIALGFVKSKNRDIGSVFVTTILNVIVGLIPCIGCIFQWIIINARHDTGFLKAILVWLLTIIIPFVVIFIIVITIFGLRSII